MLWLDFIFFLSFCFLPLMLKSSLRNHRHIKYWPEHSYLFIYFFLFVALMTQNVKHRMVGIKNAMKKTKIHLSLSYCNANIITHTYTLTRTQILQAVNVNDRYNWIYLQNSIKIRQKLDLMGRRQNQWKLAVRVFISSTYLSSDTIAYANNWY